ncbi:TIGR04222 domain-containing membrane protein [Thermomonospora cellulosilytica]|uniref:Uncharacterized protein (TIGR04222 family) n=1 Tax=Thermomonospora cellulosilytica TaxID=1411118 RepID=A0A7W3RAP9_9ACTN|nr:TIGR04222 domain-containing membrane protein [Thermomonospora cellulosilytica]MBA9006643.1 uncharacterized protein (TIGR04222 family) [Thermomonospora cellulosilytica]
MNGSAADVLAATGDTWGIPGSLFLTVYVFVALALTALAVAMRRTGAGSTPVRDLHAFEIAFLVGGRHRAVAAALASLRAEEAVESAGRGRLRATGGPGRSGVSTLDGAILAAIRGGREIATAELPDKYQVKRLLDDMQARLERRGLRNGADRRARLRLPALGLALLAAVGVVRVIAGVRNDRPVLLLILAIIGTVVAAAVVAATVPRLSPAGRRVLKEARREYAHLDPVNTPAWSTYGASGLAFAVAVYGLPAMSGFDPEFTDETELHRNMQAGGYTGTGGGCGGGDAGGGDGGGGGGGCGGGGCGG